jgi:hypothetical protein
LLAVSCACAMCGSGMANAHPSSTLSRKARIVVLRIETWAFLGRLSHRALPKFTIGPERCAATSVVGCRQKWK